MKKLLSLALVMAVIGTALAGCSTKDKKTLVIYTWENYVPPEVVADFERDTGIKIVYADFSTNEEMFASFSQKTDQYDIILCSDYIIQQMIRTGGMIREIDTGKLSNYKNIDPQFQSMYFDPDNDYSIPYATGSAIIVYDSAKVSFPITGYKDLWDPRLTGSVVVLDGYRDIIGMTLQMLGYSINETDPEILEIARQELLKFKPNVIAFNADTPHESLIRGDATVGYMFGSQATAARDEIPTIEFVFPEEGISTNLDCFVLSADAPNLENAYIFLDYILDGEVSAKMSSIINYANCNLAAKEFLPQEYIDNPSVNIPGSVMETAQFYLPVGDAEVLYDKIWTEFKAAR